MASSSVTRYSVEYAYTLTLKPKAFAQEPEDQYDKTSAHASARLKTLSDQFTLIAELTKNYNIHYHGIIKFPLSKKNLMKEFYKCFRTDLIIGYVNIRQIDDKPKWLEYISKDLSKTKEVIGRRPLVYDSMDNYDVNDKALYGITW